MEIKDQNSDILIDTDDNVEQEKDDYVRSVLIIDDLTYITKTIAHLLKKEKFTVVTANRASEAVLLLQNFKPDFIITDVRLPDINGFRLAQLIRKSIPAIPIIFITAYTGSFEHYYKTVKGKKAMLQKPIMKKDLLSVINNLLKP